MHDSRSAPKTAFRRTGLDRLPCFGGRLEAFVDPLLDGVTDHPVDPLSRFGSAKSYAVMSGTAATLRLANSAIRAARRRTPDGPGNQRESILASGGVSIARTRRARRSLAVGLRGSAKSAARSGGAHCYEYSAMTYMDLVSRGATNLPVVRVELGKTDHVFTMIGDPRASKDAVVVDAWAISPQAHLWRHSEWSRKGHGGVNIVDSHKPIFGDPRFRLAESKPKPIRTHEARQLLDVEAGQTLAERAEQLATEKWVWNKPMATRDGPMAYCDPFGAVVRL